MPLSIIVLFLCEGLLILFAVYLVWSWFMKTPFYPSNLYRLDKLYKEGKIVLPKDSKFIDIGSGDGRIVAWAAKQGNTAHGIEFNPFLSLFSKVMLFIRGLSGRTKIMNKDFRKHDFREYDVAYMYIFPEHMEQVKDKLFKEMSKGSIIITNTFTLKDIQPDEKHDRFYIYRVK